MKLCSFVTIFLVICRLSCGDIDLLNVEIPNIVDLEAIKERCEVKGDKGTYEKVKASKIELQNCLQELLDSEVLKNEVEEAKKTGSMDEVFEKYCMKKSKIQTCVKSFTDAIQPCLEDNEKESLNITLNILKQLGDFVCYRDGDRIAMFVAEGGVECIAGRVEGIKTCVNNTLKLNNSIPVTFFDKQKCDDFGKLQACVVADLKKCKTTAPADTVDALFRFIRRSTCNHKSKRRIHKILKRSVEVFYKVYHSEALRLKVLKIIKDKCRTNAGDDGYKQLITSVQEGLRCYRVYQSEEVGFPSTIDDFKEMMEYCSADTYEMMKKCLPDSGKSYLNLIKDMLYSLVEAVINNKARIIGPKLRWSCLKYFSSPGSFRFVTKCLVEIQGELNENTLFNKTVTCQRLYGTEKCLNNLITHLCEYDIQSREKILKLLEDGFTALKAPCLKEGIIGQ